MQNLVQIGLHFEHALARGDHHDGVVGAEQVSVEVVLGQDVQGHVDGLQEVAVHRVARHRVVHLRGGAGGAHGRCGDVVGGLVITTAGVGVTVRGGLRVRGHRRDRQAAPRAGLHRGQNMGWHAPSNAPGVFPELLAQTVNLRRLVELSDILDDDFKRVLVLEAVRGLAKRALGVQI